MPTVSRALSSILPVVVSLVIPLLGCQPPQTLGNPRCLQTSCTTPLRSYGDTTDLPITPQFVGSGRARIAWGLTLPPARGFSCDAKNDVSPRANWVMNP